MSIILRKYNPIDLKEDGGGSFKRVFGHGQTSEFDPFLMLDYFDIESSKQSVGFPWHPHKGIETITYILRGGIEHQDSLGNKGVISSGEVQWMTAGKGIMHQEMLAPTNDGIQGFQFWVNLRAVDKLTEPKYAYISSKEMKEVKSDTHTVKVISGTYNGIKGPIDKKELGISLQHIQVKEGNYIKIKRFQGKQGFMFKGKGLLNDESVESITTYTLDSGEFLFTANEDTEFIFAEGLPINESIAWHGPVVMNTQEELRETFRSIQDGTFIKGDFS